jgi:hypothetical protein
MTSATKSKFELLFAPSLIKKKPEKEVIRATVQWTGFILTMDGLVRIRKRTANATL